MGAQPDDRVDRLERDLARLEQELTALRARVERAERPAGRSASTWAPPRAAAPRPSSTPWASPAIPVQEPPRRPDIVLDSETALKWGGVGLVVLAVGFAVSTAISRGWIGPEAQLAGAIAVGIGLVVAGIRLRPTRPAWTHALVSGGVAALFTTFASDLFLDQATDRWAFGATAAIGGGGFVLARHLRSEWVATVTLAGGVIGWFVIGRSDPPVQASVTWVMVLIAAAIALALEQRWFALRPAAEAAGLLVLLGLSSEPLGGGERVTVVIAAALLAAALFSLPSVGDLSSVWQQLEVQLSIAVAPWAVGVVHQSGVLDSDSDRVVGSAALLIGGVTLLAALGGRRRLLHAHFVSLLISAGIAASIGLALLLSTTTVFVALAVQGAGLVVLSRVLGRDVRVLVNAAVLSGIATLYTVDRMLDAWTDDAPIGDDIAHALIIVALAVGIWQTAERVVWRVGALATLGLVLVWLGSVFVHLPQGQAIVSVTWAVVGIAILVAGAVRKLPEVGATGLAVIGLTVGKLLTVDLREVDTLWRAGLFFVVGLGILRLGFLLPRLTRDDAPDEPGAATPGRG